MPKMNKSRLYFVSSVVICTVINVIFSCIVINWGLPLYLDTIGTFLVTFLGGPFPGIIAAVATNLLCGFFNPDSMYYAFIGVVTALCASFFSENERYKKKVNIIWLVLCSALISGVMGVSFQWILIGKSQFDYISDIAMMLAGDNKYKYFGCSLLLSILINIVDKGCSIAISIALLRIVPEETRVTIRNSGYKQKPLTKAEIAQINMKDSGTSLRVRITGMLVSVVLALTVILGIVSFRIISEQEIDESIDTVENAAILTSKSLNPSGFETFLKEGTRLEDGDDPYYMELNEMLIDIKDAFPRLEYLDVYKIKEDGWYILFSCDDDFQKNGVVGEKFDYGEDTYNIMPDMLQSKRFSIRDHRSITSYEPIYDIKGNLTDYYVAASISFGNYLSFAKNYSIKLILAFSGFFVLILAYGLWISDNTLLYPIVSLKKSIENFMVGIRDQEKLDESVRSLQKLDIRTNDEVEKLYKLLCEMTVGTTEQMRSIRMLARSNVKMQAGLIITMADIVENGDFEAKSHIQKIVAYVRLIMYGLKRKGYYTEKLTDKFMNDVEISAPLYDIGKINVPDSILKKPGKLTDEEFEQVKLHTTAGQKILENAINTMEGENYLKEARNMVAYHHERWDGTGYPEGLHGQVIPLSARIMAVADVFDALTSERVYKKAYPIEKAIKIMNEGSGSQFDPKCVEVFMDQISDVKKIMKKYR